MSSLYDHTGNIFVNLLRKLKNTYGSKIRFFEQTYF